jgi:membrane-bound metal-dependent hydrolase YbcI (DUF457 family)
MPSTLVHAFLPSACFASLKSEYAKFTKKEWLLLMGITVFLGNAPDLDIIPAFFNPDHWKAIHRAWGHNVFSLSLWIAIGAFLFIKIGKGRFSTKQAWIFSLLLVLSHVFLDAMGDRDSEGVRLGVPLLWPFTRKAFSLPWCVFSSYHLDKKVHPLLAHISSKDFWRKAVFQEIIVSLTFLSLWIFATRSYLFLMKRSRKPHVL